MGEVKVSATIANAMDQMLAHRGQVSHDQIRVYEADALVDTGAVRCVLPPFVVERLGLAIVGTRVVELADGRREAVGITEPFSITILQREETETALVLGDEVLVGQTVLQKMDLLVDCANHRVLPNPAHPDQPVTKLK